VPLNWYTGCIIGNVLVTRRFAGLHIADVSKDVVCQPDSMPTYGNRSRDVNDPNKLQLKECATHPEAPAAPASERAVLIVAERLDQR